MTNTEKMIQIMVDSGDYPRKKLSHILATESGDILENSIDILFAQWILDMRIPEDKRDYEPNRSKLWN